MRERTQLFDPRQNMRRTDYEIFHYRDQKPSDVEVHHHDFFEIYLFLSGQVEYRVEGRSFRLKKGRVSSVSSSVNLPFTHTLPAVGIS